MILDRALADLDQFREEHERLVRAEQHAARHVSALQATIAETQAMLDDAQAETRRVREHLAAHYEEQLHTAHRRLAVVEDVNTRLVAQVAALQNQAERAERAAENTRRAMLDHAGRTQ